ncbi:MAG: glutamate racemase [Micrococcaceae bacterium]
MDSKGAIGIFDSGVGGLTVARTIMDQLPQESIIYVGDTKHAPYGPLPLEKVRAYSLGIMDELVDTGVKALVIACNSASAAVLRDARERYTDRYDIPVIEVIQPAVRRAVATTRDNKIGVIGTIATIKSKAYEDAFAAAPQIEVSTQACPRFVEFVEKGITSGAELHQVAEEYLAPLQEKGTDTLILGCTHYPLLTGIIASIMGPEVALVSSAEETAQQLYRELENVGFAPEDSKPEYDFISTGDAEQFTKLATRFLGPEAASARHVEEITAIYPKEEN